MPLRPISKPLEIIIACKARRTIPQSIMEIKAKEKPIKNTVKLGGSVSPAAIPLAVDAKINIKSKNAINIPTSAVNAKPIPKYAKFLIFSMYVNPKTK